jgi:hypothetical protein
MTNSAKEEKEEASEILMKEYDPIIYPYLKL